MKISTKSWHFKLFTMFDGYYPNSTTTCQYFRGLFKNVLLIILFTALALILGFAWIAMIAEPIVMTWRWLFMDMPFTPWIGAEKESPWMLFWVSTGLHGFFASLFLHEYWKRHRKEPEPPKEGSFRAVAKEHYKGWKDKICPMVEFTDND